MFYLPLPDVDAVDYRHEVLRDLEISEVQEPVSQFAERMRGMREHLEQVQSLRYPLQKQAWFLDAAGIYCDAVSRLAEELTKPELTSRGFRRFCDFLAGYVGSAPFTSLAAELQKLKDTIGETRYAVRINGPRVEGHATTVSRITALS